MTRRVGNYGRYSGADLFLKNGAEELKFKDVAVDATMVQSIPLGVGADGLCAIEVVSGATNAATRRTGRTIFVKKLNLRLQFAMNSINDATDTNSPNSVMVRLMVVWDKQANGLAPVLTDVLTPSSFLNPADIYAHNDLTNSGRFIVLKDKFITMQVQTTHIETITEAHLRSSEVITMNKSCNIPIEYSGNLGAITERKSNNIQVFTVWEVIGGDRASTATLRITGNMRLRFADK